MPDAKKEIENSIRQKKAKALLSLKERILREALAEARERKASAVSLVIFSAMAAAAVWLFPPDFYQIPACVFLACITLLSLFRKTPFEAAGLGYMFFAGFYAYLFYCADLGDRAAAAFIFFVCGVAFTVRLKRRLTIAALLFSEAAFIYLLYLLLKTA
ncbi:MAG: hypothetical protein J6P03_05530 [Opitutales bacterium]|nr:hypothetical protein [Opitutales bacterium]